LVSGSLNDLNVEDSSSVKMKKLGSKNNETAILEKLEEIKQQNTN
jgi:hypothetical protein